MSTPAPVSVESKALIASAQHIARQIVEGSLIPYDGARRIWRECQLKLESGDHRLDPFVYWASEYEDTQDLERRALCIRAITESAALLINSGSAL